MNPKKDLKKLLEQNSIQEVAKKLRVSRQTIYNWLNGTHGFTVKNWEKVKKIG